LYLPAHGAVLGRSGLAVGPPPCPVVVHRAGGPGGQCYLWSCCCAPAPVKPAAVRPRTQDSPFYIRSALHSAGTSVIQLALFPRGPAGRGASGPGCGQAGHPGRRRVRPAALAPGSTGQPRHGGAGTAGPAHRPRRADVGQHVGQRHLRRADRYGGGPADRRAQRPAARCRRGGLPRAGAGLRGRIAGHRRHGPGVLRRRHRPRVGSLPRRAPAPRRHHRRHRLRRGLLRREQARRLGAGHCGRQDFTTVAALPVPVRYPAVTALGGQIYLFGGQAITGPHAGRR